MREYIERAQLLKNLGYDETRRADVLPGSTFDIVLKEPAADVAEVRHGHWIDHHSGGSFCSACKRWVPYSHHPKYCETCGARMDKEVE